jgi:hypothetical protein
MSVENFLPQFIPHGKIWPLKITGKIQFFAGKTLFYQKIASEHRS